MAEEPELLPEPELLTEIDGPIGRITFKTGRAAVETGIPMSRSWPAPWLSS